MNIRLKSTDADPEQIRKFARELGVPELFSLLLCDRGINTAENAAAFLNPRLTDLPSPFLLKGMDEAVSLVIQAMEEKWTICIHGDYDVDGISATALLAGFFKKLGIVTTCYQPDRMTEGYGLQPEFIRSNRPARGSVSLLITVDCGISAVAEVALAREMGYRVIVTDHHEPSDILPQANALINPKQEDCLFPFSELSGVGVAFFLAFAVRRRLVEDGIISSTKAPNLKQFMDLVALGTVADVVPLTGLNRILVRAGLEVMSADPAPWVSALKGATRIQQPEITSEDISYRFAPRINAPGRLGNPALSFELLTSDDHTRAADIAQEINNINTERRELEREAEKSVFSQCESQVESGASGIVIHGDYHPGVIGILASRVVDRYNRPVIVFTQNSVETDQLKGSGRSVETINLFEILQSCSKSVLQFGGHAMATGLTIKKDKIAVFTEKFRHAVSQRNTEERQLRLLDVNSTASAEELFDESFLNLYHQLQPFGRENPEPVFLLKDPDVRDIDTVKEHLKFILHAHGKTYRAIGFGLAGKKELLGKSGKGLAFKIKKNFFRGEERTEIHALDIIQHIDITE